LLIDPHWLEPARTGGADREPPSSLAEMERQAILDALQRCQGRIYGVGGAAAALGVKPTTLYGKMRKHHISKPTLADGRL
jgi:formate hydrogenlyase transcriptional activator